MNCLVVEDSRLARQELAHQLSATQAFGEIRAVANADEALAAIADSAPDVIFLDIHLPGKNGFELLETLDLVPRVIFTTAYDQYAIRSFEHNTIDYLLKPISPERLRQAVGKLQSTQLSKEVKSLENKVFVRDGERCWFVPLGEIRLFESVGNYARVHFDEHSPLIQKSLSALESVLDERTFYRANRQQIINLTYVKSIDAWFSDTLKVTLQTGEEIEVSRRQSARLKKLFSL
ncbi:LytR/AlgR family response regulator transcription factor [Tunicatimonas pelagia]|uniref:LytR/AlgR family response regulator transcription factor n=1 Tax=Tunicatimonas pelagia TaxID=931531 RepID=UPI0026658180|nr:LytTR family DNA-binding domain-containing protein [Tunicatimonas pelagia]WKN41781.1 LytTR family DNA-binding domain-containing protein [Tunicatimonas pelagia]